MPAADLHVGNLLPCDGEAYLFEAVLSSGDADHAFATLLNDIDWRQEHAVLFGKRIALPRLTAWFGDHGYSYSGIRHASKALPKPVLALKSTVEDLTESRFNSVLINLYRDGQDSMGWHSDDEAVLGDEPEVASLSLGAERRFHLKHRIRDERVALDLSHRSCLIMKGRCQACWRHQLPKTKRTVGPRINLTFRVIRE